MSDFKDFLHSRLLRHPTTWLIAAIAGVYGGMEMYWIREAKRAAGDELQFPWLWLERTIDFSFGAFIQIGLLSCSVWLLAGLVEHLHTWQRQGLLLIVYLIAFGLQYVL